MSRWICSTLELGFSASVVVSCGDEESGELELDLLRQRGAQQTPGESKQPSSRQRPDTFCLTFRRDIAGT